MTAELVWRRRWKADIRVMAWQSVDIGGSVYLMKTMFKEECYTFMLSDLTSIWVEDMNGSKINQRIAEMNPSLEAPVTKIIDHIQAHLCDPTKQPTLTFTSKPCTDSKEAEVLFTSLLAGITFNWKFCGTLASNDVLCDHLTLPMLTMVAEMSRRDCELIRRLQGKDREIADYKSQGVKTSRKHLETPVFDEISFVNEMNTSQELESIVKSQGMSSFTPQTRDLYMTLMTKYAWLTQTDDGDIADSDSEEITGECPPAPTVQSWGNRIPPSFSLPRKSTSPRKSPGTSPSKSPRGKSEAQRNEDAELERREALNRKFAEKDDKVSVAASKRKKKKIAF